MRSKTFVFAALTALAAGSLMASQAATQKFAATEANLVGVGELKWVDVPNTPVKMATVKYSTAFWPSRQTSFLSESGFRTT